MQVRANLAQNVPAEGFYRLKNVATGKYLVATALTASNSTTDAVFANGDANSAATVIRIFDKDNDGQLYMNNQGYGFGWVTTDGSFSSTGKVWITSSYDKYINWLPGNADNQVAFAVCLGNATGTWASQLKKGIFTADANEAVIAGTDETADAAQWIVEPATTVTVNLNSDGAEPATYYATFCAPFSYTVGSGVVAYTLAASGEWLVPTGITDEVPAGTPVLLKGSSATATLTIGTDYENAPVATTALTGSYLSKTIDGATDYVLGKSGSVVGFYHWNQNTLAANRAYIDTPAEVKGFVINWDELVDGIDQVQSSTFNVQSSTIYNLAGQRINKLQKGINIVNGKKVLVK